MKNTIYSSCIKTTIIAISCGILPAQAMWNNTIQNYLIEPSQKYIIKPIKENPKTAIGISLGLFAGYKYYQYIQERKINEMIQEKMAEKEKNSITIQSAIRGSIERKKYEEKVNTTQKMALILEPVIKGYNARKEYQNMLTDHYIRILQSACKGQLERKHYEKKLDDHAIILQSAIRGYLAREEYSPTHFKLLQETNKKISNPDYQIFPGKRISPKISLVCDILYLIGKNSGYILNTLQKEYINNKAQITFNSDYFSMIAYSLLQSAGFPNFSHIDRYSRPDFLQNICYHMAYDKNLSDLFNYDKLLHIKQNLQEQQLDLYDDTIIQPIYKVLFNYSAQQLNKKFIFDFAHATARKKLKKTKDMLWDYREYHERESHTGWWTHIKYTYDENNIDILTLFINDNEELKKFFKTISNDKNSLSDLLALEMPKAEDWVEKCEQSSKIE